METALLLAGKITELTLIVLMGIALVKSKLLTSEHSRTLSVIALYLISPSVMIHAFQIENTPEILDGLKLSVALAVAFHILLIALGRLFKTLFKLDTLEHAATVYTNSGNLIIPLVMSVFGPQWVIYTSGFIIVQTLLFWTHLRLLLCGSGKLSWKTVLTNINILSILFGILLFACQIKLPRIIDNTLATVGGMIGPVAMLVAGMLIASLPLKEIVLSKRIYLTAFLRLILIPLILLLSAAVSYSVIFLGVYFDRAMLSTLKLEHNIQNLPVVEIWHNDGDQILAFMRGDLIFVFNFNPTTSFTDYGFLVPTGAYNVVLNTDASAFGGNNLADDTVTHITNYDPLYVAERKEWLKLYIPARSAVVLRKN